MTAAAAEKRWDGRHGSPCLKAPRAGPQKGDRERSGSVKPPLHLLLFSQWFGGSFFLASPVSVVKLWILRVLNESKASLPQEFKAPSHDVLLPVSGTGSVRLSSLFSKSSQHPKKTKDSTNPAQLEQSGTPLSRPGPQSARVPPQAGVAGSAGCRIVGLENPTASQAVMIIWSDSLVRC